MTHPSTSEPLHYSAAGSTGVLGRANGDPGCVLQSTSSKALVVHYRILVIHFFSTTLYLFNCGCGTHTLQTSGCLLNPLPNWEALCSAQIPVTTKPQKQGCEGHIKIAKKKPQNTWLYQSCHLISLSWTFSHVSLHLSWFQNNEKNPSNPGC